MTIDLLTIPATDTAKLAYAEGHMNTAILFARIAKLERDNATLNDAMGSLENELVNAYKAHRNARCEVESLQAELSVLRWLER